MASAAAVVISLELEAGRKSWSEFCEYSALPVSRSTTSMPQCARLSGGWLSTAAMSLLKSFLGAGFFYPGAETCSDRTSASAQSALAERCSMGLPEIIQSRPCRDLAFHG